MLLTLPAHPCDKNGAFLAPETPPIPPPPRSNNDWTLFRSRVGFELAEFLYKEELSKPKIDHLLSLWSATLAPHGAKPPVSDYRDLHAQIDGIDLGFTSWKSWMARYQGRQPTNSAAFSWMDEEYRLWYCDPREVIHNILGNPDFSAAIDYTPYRDFRDGKRHYCDFMSSDWSWNQCVRIILRHNLEKDSFTDIFPRSSSRRIHEHMGARLFRSLLVQIKRLFRSPLASTSTTPSIY